MDKDRIVGSAKEVKGSIKEAVGKAVGDAKLQSEGESEQLEEPFAEFPALSYSRTTYTYGMALLYR